MLFLVLLASSNIVIAGGNPTPPEHLRERARHVLEIDGVVYVDAKEEGFLEIE